MKKYFYSMTAAALLLGMTACGGNKESKAEEATGTIEEALTDDAEMPQSVTVTVTDGEFADGELAEFIAIVPGDYTFNVDGSKATIEIKAKALAQADKEVSGSSKFGVYDADGNELGTMIIYGGQSNLTKALQEGDTESEFPLTLNYYGFDTDLPEFMANASELKGLSAIEPANSSSSSSSSSSTGSGSDMIDSAQLSKYISDGKSGNIDKMIDALEWQNATEAALKPQVRALNEDAIKAAIEMDKASEEVGGKYDRHSLIGALDTKTGEMSSSQLSRYNAACAKSVLYFTMNDDSSKFNDLYRKLRYGI